MPTSTRRRRRKLSAAEHLEAIWSRGWDRIHLREGPVGEAHRAQISEWRRRVDTGPRVTDDDVPLPGPIHLPSTSGWPVTIAVRG